jgi:stage V sporulation protein B
MTRIKSIAKRTIKKTLGLSVVVSTLLYIFGDDIAILVGSTAFCGKVVKMLAFVVPFIYAEIILESLLKGLGEHSFSSINYVAEYVIRISTLLICVPMFHFYGIVVSYYVSNIVGNISRAYKVYRLLADRHTDVKTLCNASSI